MTAALERTMDPTIDLTDAHDPTTVGQKAARLARLSSGGFDVPRGVVIPESVCRAWPADAESIAAHVCSALPGRLAVRSSAAAEDLEGASFAGMYTTVLEVEGVDAVQRAIGEVIDSARSERVRAYFGGDAHMAVLVQPLIAADVAGVAFTADPITGDRDVVLIQAIEGLGEALVSGEADPEEWRVGADAECERSMDVMSAEQARAVADLARRVEAHEGEPRDIEWAFANGELWLLQARPITALPVEPELEELGPGSWMKDAAHFSEPLTPFGASVYLPALGTGMATAFAEFGMLVEGLQTKLRGGELYGKVIPVGGKDGPAPPAWVLGLLARVIPPLRARMKAAREAVVGGKLESVPREWNETLRARFEAELAGLLEEDLDALSDDALLDHVERVRDLLARGQVAHFRLFMPYAIAVAELALGCEEMLGWEPVATMRLLTGLSAASSAPTRALVELAELARDRPDVRESLAALSDPSDLPADFAEAFRELMRQHGWRTTSYDPGTPTLAERPRLIARLVLDRLDHERETADAETRSLAADEARAALAGRPEDLERFETLLEAGRRCYPLREDNIALTDNAPSGMLRRAMLAIGRRLARQGRLRSAEAARFLSVEELAEALASNEDLRALTERREAEARWMRAHPGPDIMGPTPGDPPDPRWLPAEGRRVNRAFMWFMDQEMTPPEPFDGEGLRGRPGSPGKVEGRVRVVRSEADFHKLQPGEVLVCPITSPVWSVLFANAVALVTDAGGAMSHAAVIAREHGIPAVLATGTATTDLRDGEWVVVDGNAGLVTRAAR